MCSCRERDKGERGVERGRERERESVRGGEQKKGVRESKREGRWQRKRETG